MALSASAYAALTGSGGWWPLKAVAAIFFGNEVYARGAEAVVIGAVIHLITSLTIGVVFAWIIPRDVSLLPALGFGALAGVSILVIVNVLVLPTFTWTGPGAGPGARLHAMWGDVPGRVPPPIAFVDHIVFGFGLALAPALRRRSSRVGLRNGAS